MAILNAVLVLSGIGLISGIVLVIAAKLMYVAVDENVEKIQTVLPGANCGACGYAGCADYAAAVASGNAETNLCVPGADKVASEIASLLGKQALDVVELAAVVACKGCTSKAPRFDYHGIKTCVAANMYHAGPMECSYGCEGYGDCAAVCPFNAICVKNGVAYIDPKACRGCSRCVAACPKRLISLMPQVKNSVVLCSNHDKGAATSKVCKNGCIGCMKCEKVCKYDAVHVVNSCAVIDVDKCVQCKECETACPVNVIDIRKA